MDFFLGQLLLVPYSFAPAGFAFCNGQLMSISQNTALFSLLGTNYGGNGQTTFALPDLRGRIPVGQGQGPGLSIYDLGQIAGEESVPITQLEFPSHNHSLLGIPTPANVSQVAGAAPAGTGSLNLYGQGIAQLPANLHPMTLLPTGGSLPHENRMPFLTLNWIIALVGVFPARN